VHGDPDFPAGGANTADGAEALARAIVEGGRAAPPGLTPSARMRLAWKLKDRCYAAWNTAPQRAVRAAEALAQLAADEPDPLAPGAREIGALAAWTAAIAGLTRGDMAAAVARLDAAADAFRALGQRLHAAQAQVPKIVALTMQGRHAAAAECGEATLQEFVALGDSEAAAKVGLNLGSLQLRRDNFRQAAEHYREASLLFARAGDREHSVMADIGLGDALASLGDADEALRIYARAAMRAAAHGFSVLEAIVAESVALLKLARGDYRAALAGFEDARRRYAALALPQHLAIAEKQLADAYLELHLLPEAHTLFERALAEFESLEMPDDASWTLVQLGRTHALLGNAAAADAALVRAGGAFVAQDNDVGAAAVAIARAELSLGRGDAGSALVLAEAARHSYDEAKLPDRAARADLVIAEALLAQGAVSEARALFERTLADAQALQLLAIQVRSRTGQGLAARAGGDIAAAHDAFVAAVELFEEMRATLPGDELRSAFLTDHLRPFQELLRLALDAHEAAGADEEAGANGHAAAVLWQLDRLKARALGERLTDRAAGAGSVDAQRAESDVTAGLRARLSWLYRRVRKLEDEGTPSASLAAELRATEHRLLEETRRLRLAAPRWGGARPIGFELDVDALRGALQPGDALIEYGVADDELFACVATGERIAVYRRLAAWSAVREAIRGVRFQIETFGTGATPVARHLDLLTARANARLGALAALVWAPLAAAVDGCGRLLVVPHAELAAVPFAALLDQVGAAAARPALAVAPSARIAAAGLARPAAVARRALVLGESTRLPHAGAEAVEVARHFAHADLFVGDAATTAALQAHVADADVVHLACHAQFRADNPAFSALSLADGPLTVEAVESLALRAGTVVLSACETGIAEADAVAEMTGLVRAFLVAGAARVVASLWPVDDATTATFMRRYYGALGGGAAPATALQEAQAALRSERTHPYFWAAFTLYGRW